MNRPYPDDFRDWTLEARNKWFAEEARDYHTNGSARNGHDRGEPFIPQNLGNEAKASQREIIPTPYICRDPTTLPRRDFLYAKHYVRKFISTTAAPGGRGKTSLLLVEAIAMATGRPLLGVHVPKRLRIWYWNGEDPKEETERRIAAILLHFDIPPDEIEGWLFTDTGRDTPICIAERHKDAVIFGPDADALAEALTAAGIDVFTLDPFVKTHGVLENDNGSIDRVARKYAAIADTANCSIELAHHVRKASGLGRAEVTVDDLRGAGSLVDAARSNRLLNVMMDEEATAAQVKPEARKRYFRVDNGKENMAPPTEAATWFKLVSVCLGNHEIFDQGDWVGVVTSWEVPGVFAGVTTVDLAKVQAAIDRGSWAKDVQASDWAGYAIAETLEIDASEDSGKARVKKLLAAWIASGALKVIAATNPKSRGHTRQTVIVGNRV